jgi:hypothetical protein
VLNQVLASVVSLCCIMGAFRNSSAPIPNDSLHSSPFYLKGPRTAATEKPPETRGHPGCNDKSKNYPRAHKRRIKPPQAISFRYPWDSVSRSHQTLCHPLHPQCTNYLFWLEKTLSSLSIISFPPSILKYNHILCDEYHYTFYAKKIPSETHFPRRHFPQDTTPGPKSGDPHPPDKLSNGGIRRKNKKGNRSPKSQTDLSFSVFMIKWRPRADFCLQRQEKLDIIHISTSQTSWPNEDGERRLLPPKTRKVGYHPYIYLPDLMTKWRRGA